MDKLQAYMYMYIWFMGDWHTSFGRLSYVTKEFGKCITTVDTKRHETIVEDSYVESDSMFNRFVVFFHDGIFVALLLFYFILC